MEGTFLGTLIGRVFKRCSSVLFFVHSVFENSLQPLQLAHKELHAEFNFGSKCTFLDSSLWELKMFVSVFVEDISETSFTWEE